MKVTIDVERVLSIIAIIGVPILTAYLFYDAGKVANRQEMFKQYILVDRTMVTKYGATAVVIREGDIQYDIVVRNQHIRWEFDTCK